MKSVEQERKQKEMVIRWYAVKDNPDSDRRYSQMSSQAPSPVAPTCLPCVPRPPSAPLLNNGNGSVGSQGQPRFRLLSAPPMPGLNNTSGGQNQAKLLSATADAQKTAVANAYSTSLPSQQTDETLTANSSSSLAVMPAQSMAVVATSASGLNSNGNNNGHVPVSGNLSAAAVPVTLMTASSNDQAVTKCARFFKTLLHLSEKQQNSQQQEPGTAVAVKQLVQGVVFGGLSPEAFTVRLQQALNSQAQRNLLPFLRQTLPALRRALHNGEQVIEGIGTAEEYAQEMMIKNSVGLNAAGNGSTISNNYAEANNIRSNQSQMIAGVPIVKQEVKQENNNNYSLSALDTSIDSVINNVAGTSSSFSINVSGAAASTSANESLPPQPPPSSSNNVLTRPQISSMLMQITLLNAQALADRIFNRVGDCEGLEPDVLELISNATETRLRSLLSHLSVAAEHRLEPLRMTPNYQQLDEPRKQLRFMEDIERQAHERRENQEREALIRFSKSKGKDKDTMEKAKLVQKADKEAAMNREANAAAIAALGGSRGVKRPHSSNANNHYGGTSSALGATGGAYPLQESAGAGLSLQTHRPRMKRVTMRDLQFVLSADPFVTSSNLRHKLAFAGPAGSGPGGSDQQSSQ